MQVNTYLDFNRLLASSLYLQYGAVQPVNQCGQIHLALDYVKVPNKIYVKGQINNETS